MAVLCSEIWRLIGVVFVLQLPGQTVGFEMKISPGQMRQQFSISSNRLLMCMASVAENNQRPSLHWEIDGVQVTATNKNARVRTEKVNDGSLMLRVEKVQDGDEGTYKCVATLGSQSDSRSVTVVVIQYLKVLSPKSQYGIFGTDGSVKCEAVAKPAPSTTWKFYNGTKIQSGTKYIIQQDQMIIKDLNEGDSATYMCDIVVIETGASEKLDIVYQVVRIPKIGMIPTIYPNNPKVGDSEVKITCHASGYPQPTYEFRKGDNIMPETQVDEQKGILTINDLKREDEGVYTCVAKNRGGSNEKSNHLDVKIAPIIQPISDVKDAVEGGQQRVTCMAEGDPAPTVIWQKQVQLHYTNDGIKDSGPNLIDEAGTDREDAEIKRVGKTMDFTFIKPQDAGTYVCMAINIVGNASTTVKFEVRYKPHFDTDYKVTTFYGWRGSTANLTCLASANEVATIKWYEIKDNRTVLIESEAPFTKRDPQVWPEYYLSSSSLLVDVSDDTSPVFKDYTCEATNSLGSANQTVTLRRALPPGQPVVHVLSTLPTKVTIEIDIPKENGGQPVTGYHYSYRVDTAGAIPIENNIEHTQETTNLELKDLKPNTQYILRVSARNAVGLGTETPVTFQTKEVSLPGKLELLSPAEGPEPTSYTFKWADVDDGGSPVTDIVIKYRRVLVTGTDSSQWRVSGDLDKSFTIVKVPNVKSTSYTLSGLERDTYYDIRITAFNKEGESPETSQIIRTSPGAPPQQPPQLYLAGQRLESLWVEVVENQTLNITCRVPGGDTEVYRTIIKCNNTQQPFESDGSSITMDVHVTRAFHGQNCTCSALHAASYTQTSSVEIRVTSTTPIITTETSTTAETLTTRPGTAPKVRQDFECHLNYMNVFIPVDLVPNSELTLRDATCRLTNNGTHYKISFDYNECGTSQSFYTDYVSVDNDVNVRSIFNDTVDITFVEDYKIPLHCSVDRSKNVNAAIQVLPRESIQESIVQSTDFYMKEFTTRDYDEEITEYPVKLPINREIFFEIALRNKSSNSTGVFVEKCEATPSADPNDTVHVSLIKFGCSAIPAVKVLPAPGKDRFRFSTQAFHFSTPANVSNLVYVHCSMSTCGGVMCDTACPQSSRRRKRSARGGAFETLTSGSHVVTKDGN